MDGMPGLDSEQIRHAITTAQSRGFRQVRIRLGEDRFSAVLSAAPALEPEESDEPEVALVTAPKGLSVASPAVGYFRAVVELRAGNKVSEGDKVGEVVALGIANDVYAGGSGEVEEVLVSDGDAVEFGQSLVKLRP